MPNRKRRPIGFATSVFRTLLRWTGAATAAVLMSCGSVSSLEEPTSASDMGPAPRFSIVYVIHGDGGYRYHDSSGNEYQADQVALAGAMEVAEGSPKAEVFIFHQKRKRRFLGLFWHLSDGEFYYYRNGRLIIEESYRRDSGQSRFEPEATLYHTLDPQKRSVDARLFLYFGHEIPEFNGTNYDASYRKQSFTVTDLARGLNRLVGASAKFDVVALSTCFNGTPHSVSTLAPFARYIVASPANLHLSYLDDEPLIDLNRTLKDRDVLSWAKEFARHSFLRLTQELQTEVSIAVYDVDRVDDYLRSVEDEYQAVLDTLAEKNVRFVNHFDCAESPTFARSDMSDGVEVFYRAARFGRSKNKTSHSGWECVGKTSDVRRPMSDP